MRRPSIRLAAAVIACLLIAALLSWRVSTDTPIARPGVARGLLSVPTNQLSGLSPDVSDSTGVTATGGAVRDTGVTNATRSSGGGSWQLPTASTCSLSTSDPLTATQSPLDGNGLCANSGGSGITTYQVPVVAGQNYTFKFYLRSEAEPRGQVTVFASAYTSGGAAINSWSGGNQFWSDNAVNSRAAAWEETPEYIPIPAGVGKVSFTITRYLPNSSPTSKMWVDDLYLGDGFVHEESTAAKTPFNGSRIKIDANGAFQRKRPDGTWVDHFPMCMATAGLRGSDWSIYASNGWNCAWAVPTDALQSTYWNGSGYSATNWSTSGNTFPAIAKRAVNSEFAPDGMLINVDIQSAVRGNLVWSPSEVTKLTSAIDNLYANGYGAQIGGLMRDGEWNQSLYPRMQAVWSVVDARDKANNGGVRSVPIITNVGLPGNARAYTAADGAGTLRTDYVGAYSGNLGPQRQLVEMPNNTAPGGYCQIQSGLGWSFRAIVYRCLGEGGHMISFWADNGQAGTAYSLPSNPSPFGSYPLDATNGGSPYEPWFYSGDSVYIAREINTLLPLLKTPVPTDWAVTSSNSNVSVWPRTAADGTPHIILANNTTTAQTATFTVYGLTAVSSIKNGITGATITPTSSTSSTITMTIPGLAAASSAGNGGGTMVLKLQGSGISGATTTLATTTTTTIPAGTIDDADGTVTYAGSWASYSGSSGLSSDWNTTLHESATTGATITVPWTGTSLAIYGPKYSLGGQFSVAVDGGASTTFSSYAASESRQQLLGTVTASAGSHTATITVLGTKESSSVGYYVGFDKAIASGSTGTTTSTTTTLPASDDWLYKTSPPTPSTTIALGSGYAVEAGVRINAACSGTLPGVWWYRTTEDTGTITASVWDTSGTLLASASADPAAGPGWRYIAFSSAPSVSSGSQYVIGIHHPNGAYAYSANGFTSRTLTSPDACLVAPANNSGARQSLYNYSASPTFPTLSYNDSEYFISPAFRAAPATTTTTTIATTTTTTPNPPGLVFRDDFDDVPNFSDNSPDESTGAHHPWRQNDVWQDSQKGYIDFTGNHGSWNANKYETINVAGGGTTTLDPWSASGGVLTITNAALASNLQADIVSKANAQGQSPSTAPVRYGGYMVTDSRYTNPITGTALKFKGGYFEWKTKTPDFTGSNAKGLFPGLWLYASDGSADVLNKGQAEIDVAEMFQLAAGNVWSRTLHWWDNAGGRVYPDSTIGDSTIDPTAWHTWGLDWLLPTDPGGPRLDFYLDGSLVQSYTSANAGWFNTWMSMRIDFKANADGFPSLQTDGTTANSSRLQVDYVAVWSSRAAALGTTTTTTVPTTTTTTTTTTPTISSCSTYQAEAASLNGPSIKRTPRTGYAGTAYSDWIGRDTRSTITWTITAPTTGSYAISTRYAADAAARRTLQVDGLTAGSLSFPKTSGWLGSSVTVVLSKGTHKITLTSTSATDGSVSIDQLSACGVPLTTAPPTTRKVF